MQQVHMCQCTYRGFVNDTCVRQTICHLGSYNMTFSLNCLELKQGATVILTSPKNKLLKGNYTRLVDTSGYLPEPNPRIHYTWKAPATGRSTLASSLGGEIEEESASRYKTKTRSPDLCFYLHARIPNHGHHYAAKLKEVTHILPSTIWLKEMTR